ncbi:MAG TPA: GNAT family N-acetyltransferase [Kofleriaceae bacterium]|jgi:GNAT superfamily N-acetyltransferase
MIVVREASEADLPAILAIYAQPELDAGDVLSLDDARDRLARFARYPDYKLYVALDAGAIVGTYALLVMDNLLHHGAPSGVVEDVGVAPDLHGRGIGKAMMQHAMQRCRERGCYKLALSSNAKRSNAHAFYASLGFEQHGVSFHVTL